MAPKRKKKDEAKNEIQEKLLELSVRHPLMSILSELNEILQYSQFDEQDRRWFREELMDIMLAKGLEVIEYTGSLAEQYKIEAFKEQLADNPYQLKLIA